jgi:hypothetical protein
MVRTKEARNPAIAASNNVIPETLEFRVSLAKVGVVSVMSVSSLT